MAIPSFGWREVRSVRSVPPPNVSYKCGTVSLIAVVVTTEPFSSGKGTGTQPSDHKAFLVRRIFSHVFP